MSPTTGFLTQSGLGQGPPGVGHGCQQQAHLSPWSDPTLTMHPWTAHSKTRSLNLKSASSLALSYLNPFISFFGCFQFACFTGLFFVDGLISF